MKLTAVLFDRDGTVIFDRNYLSDPAGVELIPGAGGAVASLCAQGIGAFLVSNQSGIGRGYFPESAWHACHARLGELLAEQGGAFRDARFCPHAPEAGCRCRKPGTGMWESLRDAHGLKAEESAMVGDKLEDVEFGANAGLAAAVLVLTGKGVAAAEKLGLSPEAAGPEGFAPVPDDAAGGIGARGRTRIFVASDAAAAVRGLMALQRS